MIKVRGGFTLVELMITMVIMVILTVLAVVVIGNIQVQARDNEREQEIQIIARGLEQYYNLGNPFYKPGGTKGSYPGSNMMITISGAGWCDGTFIPNAANAASFSKCSPEGYFTEALPGTTIKSVTPPGYNTPQLITPWLPSDLNTVITEALNKNQYVYYPMFSSSRDLCYEYTLCTRYELKYKKEATGEIITIKSRHQQ